MPQSLSKIAIHLVFSTKQRDRFLNDSIRDRLHGYLGGILHGLECPPVAINSVEDHIHLLFLLSRTRTIADIVRDIKRGSSMWLKEHDSSIPHFSWQAGYGAFSVSESQMDSVIQYIAKQREHHRKVTFQEEFREWLSKYGIEFDERYVWD